MEIENYLDTLNTLSIHESEFRKNCGHISLLEYRVLDLVFDEALNMKKISHSRGATPQAIGRVCTRLQERGIINIDRDARDGRARKVSLTPIGIALHGKGSEVLEDIIAQFD